VNASLLSVSTSQALDLWSELHQAHAGDNRYGGDVAEIYLFRLLPASPLNDDRTNPATVAAYRTANHALHGLCRLFEERMHAVVTFEDGTDIDPLLADPPANHRIHLRVSRHERGN
jgi:hypothetical protein